MNGSCNQETFRNRLQIKIEKFRQLKDKRRLRIQIDKFSDNNKSENHLGSDLQDFKYQKQLTFNTKNKNHQEALFSFRASPISKKDNSPNCFTNKNSDDSLIESPLLNISNPKIDGKIEGFYNQSKADLNTNDATPKNILSQSLNNNDQRKSVSLNLEQTLQMQERITAITEKITKQKRNKNKLILNNKVKTLLDRIRTQQGNQSPKFAQS
ncbi:UNKNOWN [Stylonychia lemnae]|uniref:Uncharacterized protein n=1 Tax=Stylonychia lemnae TaxID=5949 RepID=A0A078B226_STYLE|nr:UNKNOWN [Stylonychia lemnae]|eukprot:CDW87423.1 UNKNOWN [Stylonychia lemnae]